ncbi:glycosyltransferase [Streptomyces sp. NPDC048018]|uniref:glycosyltransferase n=1 Tax=Streptomyces sp. NPDC048018 TaxID=3365499 RepID=UPI003717629A
MPSIVIPAHNEERTLGRLLDRLLDGSSADEFDILVVCNGCTDATADVAAARGPRVRVVETPVPSKHEALRLGDEHAHGFPRIYVDADVELGAADVRALTGALTGPDGVLAAAPERELPMTGCSWRVRAYYRVWQRLPAVRDGLFGRGVIAMSGEGHARVAALPPLMADDLAASLAFGPAERAVVPTARVVVRPPRTWADLIRRRVRAATSTAQLEDHQRRSAPAGSAAPAGAGGPGEAGAPAEVTRSAGPADFAGVAGSAGSVPGAETAEVAGSVRGTETVEAAESVRPAQPFRAGVSAQPPAPVGSTPSPSARTGLGDLRAILRAEPTLLPAMFVFLTAALAARRGARRAIRKRDFDTWLRDESSRQD